MAKVIVWYKAQITIYSEFDETKDSLLPFEELEKNVKEQTTPKLKELITSELGFGKNNIKITQLSAGALRCEDGRCEDVE